MPLRGSAPPGSPRLSRGAASSCGIVLGIGLGMGLGMGLGIGLGIGASGCARSPEATTSLRPLDGDAVGAAGGLTDSGGREALQVMADAVGPGATRLTRTAPSGARWSDVPAAASTACDQHEVALVREIGEARENAASSSAETSGANSERDAQVRRFELRTLDGRRGVMTVTRQRGDDALASGRLVVEVSIGRVINDEALESAIEESFRDALSQYAKRRQLEDYR